MASLGLIAVIVLNAVVLSILYDRANNGGTGDGGGRGSLSEPFVASVHDERGYMPCRVGTGTPEPLERVVLYVRFLESETRFKHVGGFPTHYNHLLFNAVVKLLELKAKYPQLDRVVVRVPPDFPNRPFLEYTERLLPFVRVDASPVDASSLRTYHNIYTFVIPFVRRADLRRLHDYAVERFPFEPAGAHGEYVVMVVRRHDPNIPDRNGAARRSIENIEEVEQVVRTFLRARHMELRVVKLESMGILEQVALFQNASGVIAQHGAALANTVWCRRCQLVVEFTSHNNMYFERHGFHQFATEWFVQNYGKNHLNVDVHALANMLRMSKLGA